METVDRGQADGIGLADHRVRFAIVLEHVGALTDRDTGDAHAVLHLDPGRDRLVGRAGREWGRGDQQQSECQKRTFHLSSGTVIEVGYRDGPATTTWLPSTCRRPSRNQRTA